MLNNSRYYFENGLRKVHPYYFQYKTHVKSRWIGRTIIDVFIQELGQKFEIIKEEISKNLVYVLSNHGKKTESEQVKGWNNLKDRLIQRHDVILNLKHMHEPSVVHQPESIVSYHPSQPNTSIEIVYEDKDLLVINKPSGIPTHPTGTYRYNSITEILKYDLCLHNIWPCHRLDQATSGILILALNKDKCNEIVEVINTKKDSTRKYYYARVKGRFPEFEFTIKCPIFSINTTGGYISQSNIEKLPTHSVTRFKRERYIENLDESIVICKPLTGRMHQIRIHLRNLGHPIVNDSYYNFAASNSIDSKINMEKNKIELELYRRLFKKFPSYNEPRKELLLKEIDQSDCINLLEIAGVYDDESIKVRLETLKTQRQEAIKKSKSQYNTICKECNRELFDTDKDVSNSTIWLHAFKYEHYIDENNSFSFETRTPKWINV